MSNKQGFTLIELLIVIVILGILAALAIPKVSNMTYRSYFAAMEADLKNLASQQETYYARMPKITMTISSSISVKPCLLLILGPKSCMAMIYE
jgi:prepilin-type N-terminal cleavage/methylation domain-containing protein